MGTAATKLRLYFQEVSFIINNSERDDLCRSRRTLVDTSEQGADFCG